MVNVDESSDFRWFVTQMDVTGGVRVTGLTGIDFNTFGTRLYVASPGLASSPAATPLPPQAMSSCMTGARRSWSSRCHRSEAFWGDARAVRSDRSANQRAIEHLRLEWCGGGNPR
jgi:hypothetical protein